MLRARSIAFKSGNETEYKAAKYALEKAIRAAKRQYRVKLDGFYSAADSGRMWQGLQHITDYRTTTSTISSISISLQPLRDLQPHHREEALTHQEHPPPLPPTNRLIRTGTQSPEEHQPSQGSRTR